MNKIPTIFDRDWAGDRRIVDSYVVDPAMLRDAVATEKLDGMNVRLTVRNETLVRLEKRRNPDRIQKDRGIEEPWYVDCGKDPVDQYLWDAASRADLCDIPDGEWSGEAVGPNIQGNTLSLSLNRVVLFSLGQAPMLTDVPVTFAELAEWLPKQQSLYGVGPIEGVVWHCKDGSMAKIKAKDFAADARQRRGVK